MLGAGLLARNAVERGLKTQAVGEDHARARLEGRDRVLRARRPHRRPRRARLQPRRLRLHDVHRQLRPAAGGDLAGRSTTTTSRSCSVLSGNRNFEGRINPDVKMNYLASPPLVVAYALAGHDGRRPARTTRSARTPTASRSTCATSGRRRGGRADDRAGRPVRHVRASPTTTSSRATSTGSALDDPDRRPLRVGRQLDLRAEPAVLRRTCRPSRRRSRDISGARVLALLGDSRHDRPHLARGRDQAGQPGRRGTCIEHGVEPQGLQLLRRAARQPRGDDARHVREHPPAQPARAGHRGRRHAAPARAASR